MFGSIAAAGLKDSGEIVAVSETIYFSETVIRLQTGVSLRRPLARRDLSTRRPPFVLIRARKP